MFQSGKVEQNHLSYVYRRPTGRVETTRKLKVDDKVDPINEESFAQIAKIELLVGIKDTSREGNLEEEHLKALKASLLRAIDDLGVDEKEIGFVVNVRLE